jgi:hypothetical protein
VTNHTPRGTTPYIGSFYHVGRFLARGKELNGMDKMTLSRQIADALFDDEMLNTFDYNGDINGLLEDVQGVIYDKLKDYAILQGIVF